MFKHFQQTCVFASVMVYQCPCVTLHKGIIAEGGGHLKVVLNK